MSWKSFEPTEPSGHYVAVTPSNTVNLPAGATRGLYVGAAGDVKVDSPNGDTVTFVGLAAGMIHPIRALRVYATLTTATSIVAIY